MQLILWILGIHIIGEQVEVTVYSYKNLDCMGELMALKRCFHLRHCSAFVELLGSADEFSSTSESLERHKITRSFFFYCTANVLVDFLQKWKVQFLSGLSGQKQDNFF